MKTTIKRFWMCLLVLPALAAGGAWAQEAEPEPVFAGTPAKATGPRFEPVFEGKATPSGPQYDEAGNLIPPGVAWAGPVATPRQLAAERATVDEYAAMLGSGDLGEQLDAVTVLANLADRAWEPKRIRALLEAARSDRDVALATHADVSLKRLDGIETLTAAERRARARGTRRA